MAKTIMISNDAYRDLRRIKHNRSFTETIKYLLEKKESKKIGAALRECAGLLEKEDNEYEKAMKELKPLYGKWNKKYA